jgi:CHAT domain-containing protein
VRCLALARLGQPAQALEALKPLDHLAAFTRRTHADVIENLDLLRMECLTDLNRIEEANRVLEELGPRLAARYAPGHPRRVRAEFIQATLLRSQHRDAAAIDVLEKVMLAQRDFLVQSAVDLPEESLLAVSRHMERDLARYLGDVLGFHRETPSRVATAFEITVNRKGLGLDAAADWHRARRGNVRSTNRPALLQPQPISLSELQATLGRDVTIVEYARAAVGGREPTSARVDHYIAFVLERGSDQVRLIDLGDAAPIDAKVQEFRRSIDPEKARGLGAAQPASSEKSDSPKWQSTHRDLHRSCFEPIANTLSLQPGEPLLLSPAGALSWISFSALLQPTGRFLIEDHSIRLATSAARAVQRRSNGATAGPPALFGAPDFGTAPGGAWRSRRLPHGLCDRIGPFASLPGTLQEIECVRALYAAHALPVDVLTGQAASARGVLDLNPVRRLLHIATHGFFVPPAYLPTDLAALTLLPERATVKDQASLAGLSPYLRCGLALAGANANGDQEQGLLTAEDLLACSLEGTQLVVLSACETARGDVSGLCDVQSLVRAFLIAGTDAVVASLWQVPDRETAELMTAFHSNWITHSAAAEALQSAVRQFLANARARGLDPDPLVWAAFQVFVG